MWALVLGTQGHERPHIHFSGWLSGCYYVQTSDVLTSEDDGRQGWIEFGEPLPVYRSRPESRTKWVRPEEGSMVLFPSFVFHRTAPFVAEAKRICIAFDVRAEPQSLASAALASTRPATMGPVSARYSFMYGVSM